MPDPLIIGHRGASALAPENTLIAFERALHDGADGLEFDVHVAADGVPVIIHDDTLRRTASRPERVADLTSAELGSIEVGRWFNRKFPERADVTFASACVPKLAEVFALATTRRPLLYIELKWQNATTLAEPVARMIDSFDARDYSIVESFDHSALKAIKKVDPAIRTAALFEPTLLRPKPTARWLINRATEAGADEVALHHTLATRRVVAQLTEHGYPVVIWTADNPAGVARAQTYGIHAIITNNPKKLLDVRR
jgi:glycerophosphoryl diester phosphodiesterase